MFLQGNTFAPEKACPDGQSRWRRDFRTKGKRRDKKGDLPTAVLKKTNFLREASGGGLFNMLSGFLRNLGGGNVSGLNIAGLIAAAYLVFGRFGWLGKIAGLFLGMMLIGNNAGVVRTVPSETVSRTQTPTLSPEEQTQSGGMRR